MTCVNYYMRNCLFIIALISFFCLLNELVASQVDDYPPIADVVAEKVDESTIKIYWSWTDIIPDSVYVDFETGDFRQADWNNEITPNFPWIVVSNDSFDGEYCMKSTGSGQTDAISEIEIMIDVPFDAKMSFYHKVSSEPQWDFARFYIDDEEMFSLSGELDWEYVEFDVAAGLHTYRWSYKKDDTGHINADSYFVDCVCLYKRDAYNEKSAFESFNIYKSDCNEDEMLLITSNVNDTLYYENDWSSYDAGMYKWGVSAVYNDEKSVKEESAVIWSDCIDKDMFTSVELSVGTNCGDVVTGAEASLINISEPMIPYNYYAVLDESGFYRWENVRRGAYVFNVSLKGYSSSVTYDTIYIWDEVHLECLLEEIAASVDDLYVSATGWVMWNNEIWSKEVQSYTVMLDGVVEGEVSDTFYQHENIVPGEIYTTTVVANYDTGSSESKDYTWTCLECNLFQGPLQMIVKMSNNQPELNWIVDPNTVFPTGVIIYHDGELMTPEPIPTNYYYFISSEDIEYGVHEFCIRFIYDEIDNIENSYYAMSCPECETLIFTDTCYVPQDLYAEYYHDGGDTYGVNLSWNYSEQIDDSKYYLYNYNIYRSEDNENYEKIAYTQQQTFFDEVEIGTYYYKVKAVYKKGIELYETDAATSLNDVSQDFVMVEVTNIDDNVFEDIKIYPNPANNFIVIEMNNMKSVSLYDILGRKVYTDEESGDKKVIDMSLYEDGNYILGVMTDEGVFVKQVSLIK